MKKQIETIFDHGPPLPTQPETTTRAAHNPQPIPQFSTQSTHKIFDFSLQGGLLSSYFKLCAG
jgi:hypothetical protein